MPLSRSFYDTHSLQQQHSKSISVAIVMITNVSAGIPEMTLFRWVWVTSATPSRRTCSLFPYSWFVGGLHVIGPQPTEPQRKLLETDYTQVRRCAGTAYVRHSVMQAREARKAC